MARPHHHSNMRLRRYVAAAALILAACGTTSSGPAPQGPGDGPAPVPVAAPPASSPDSQAPGQPADAAWRDLVAQAVIFPTATTAPGWIAAFTIPFGEEEAQAGNGLMESLLDDPMEKADYGPSLATLDSRGRWWVADPWKSRIARYGADGTYLDSIPLEATKPLEALEVFHDGTALGMTADRRWVVVADDRASTVAAGTDLLFAGNDGTNAYAWPLYGKGIDAITVGERRLPEGREVRWFQTRAGTRFGIDFAADDQIAVTLPDARTRVTLDVVADTGQPVFVSAEIDTDSAGNLHFLLLGSVTAAPLEGEDDERHVPRAAHVVLSPEGDVLANRPVPNPYGAWDYGIPQRFVVDPASGRAHLVTVQPDGVHVWQSTAAWAAPSPGASVEIGFPSGS